MIKTKGEARKTHVRRVVKVGTARNSDIREQVLVAIGRDGSGEAVRRAVAVGADGRDAEEEGLAGGDAVVEEAQGAVADVVGRVGAGFVAVGGAVEGHDGVEVLVRVGVEED